jgi:hypothetical protein
VEILRLSNFGRLVSAAHSRHNVQMVARNWWLRKSNGCGIMWYNLTLYITTFEFLILVIVLCLTRYSYYLR